MVTRATGINGYNVICPVCGWKYKASEMLRRWDGLMVCKTDWEPRHPMDFFRTIPDQHSLPFVMPDFEDVPSSESGNALFSGNPTQRCVAYKRGSGLDFIPRSIEFWMRNDTAVLPATVYVITENLGFWSIQMDPFRCLNVYYWFSGVQYKYTSTYSLPVTAWTKIEITAPIGQSLELQIYDISGTLLSTEFLTAAMQAQSVYSDHVTIGGANASTSQMWTGAIDELRLWKTPRTQQQFADFRFKELTGGEPELFLYLNFNAKTVFGWNDLTSNSTYRQDQGFLINPKQVTFQTNTFMRP